MNFPEIGNSRRIVRQFRKIDLWDLGFLRVIPQSGKKVFNISQSLSPQNYSHKRCLRLKLTLKLWNQTYDVETLWYPQNRQYGAQREGGICKIWGWYVFLSQWAHNRSSSENLTRQSALAENGVRFPAFGAWILTPIGLASILWIVSNMMPAPKRMSWNRITLKWGTLSGTNLYRSITTFTGRILTGFSWFSGQFEEF